MDGIFPALLQRDLKIILGSLLRVVRGSIFLGYIQDFCRPAWTKVFVAKQLIFFRPICLASFKLKTVKKGLFNYIRTNAIPYN